MKAELKKVFEKIEIARAIQTLKYHDKSLLWKCGDCESMIREPIDRLTECLNILSDLIVRAK